MSKGSLEGEVQTCYAHRCSLSLLAGRQLSDPRAELLCRFGQPHAFSASHPSHGAQVILMYLMYTRVSSEALPGGDNELSSSIKPAVPLTPLSLPAAAQLLSFMGPAFPASHTRAVLPL